MKTSNSNTNKKAEGFKMDTIKERIQATKNMLKDMPRMRKNLLDMEREITELKAYLLRVKSTNYSNQ